MQPRTSLASCVALLILLPLVQAVEESDIKWKQVGKAEGAFKTPASGQRTARSARDDGGGANNNRGFDFSTKSSSFRLNYEFKSLARICDLRIDIQKLVTRNGKPDWVRIGTMRSHQSEKDSKTIKVGPGKYRIEITGDDMEYKVSVEIPIE